MSGEIKSETLPERPRATCGDDHTLAMWLTPDAIREHLEEAADPETDALLVAVTDDELAAAAGEVIMDDRIWSLFQELAEDVLRGAVERAKVRAQHGQMQVAAEAPFPHTDRIDALLKQGKADEAAREHNANVAHEFARAEAGETINLTDLMASKESLILAETTQNPTKPPSPVPAPVKMPDRAEIVKAINRKLRDAGLTEVSAHGARGTAWGWIEIAPKHREGDDYRSFTSEERDRLAATFGGPPSLYSSNVVSDEMEDWAERLGLIPPSPARAAERERRMWED